MALGTNRTRNWGREAQEIALALLLKHRRVAYQVKPRGTLLELWLTPSHNGLTLPFTETVASLVNVRRGLWHAESPFDGRVLAKGISQRDVVRATIQTVWN